MYLIIFPDGKRAHFSTQADFCNSLRDNLAKKKDKWVNIKCYFTASKNVNEAFQKLYGIQ
jgi:hypothetical protein